MLPGSVRKQVSLAYLSVVLLIQLLILLSSPVGGYKFCEAFRQFLLTYSFLDDLKQLRAALLPQRTQQEAYQLLYHLPACFHLFVRLSAVDRQLVRELVLTLTHGMEMDLQYFSNSSTVQPFPIWLFLTSLLCGGGSRVLDQDP